MPRKVLANMNLSKSMNTLSTTKPGINLGNYADAISCYNEVLRIDPLAADGLVNRGNTFKEIGRVSEAIQDYIRAVTIRPTMAEAHANLASAYKDSGLVEAAIKSYKQALLLRPDFPEATCNLLHTLQEELIGLGCGSDTGSPVDQIAWIRVKAAILTGQCDSGHEFGRAMCLSAATILSSQSRSIFIDRLLAAQFGMSCIAKMRECECVCNWEDRESKFIEVEGIIRRQIKMSVLPSVQPFHAIAYPIDPVLALEISIKYAAHCSLIASRYGLPPFTHPSPVPVKSEGGSGRLRVGYVSSDFGNHPLSHLMGSVFGMHNRENVEVFCYALSQNDGTEWRQRIQSEVEHFIDVSSMSSNLIARMINEDKIEVLVNLNGYTKGARNEIFAMQPAPIQVSYMGFPGTTGAAYIDYLVTDEFVSPTKFSRIYSEKLVHVPHCYFVNDYKQPIQLAFADAIAQGVRPDQIIFTDVAVKNEHIRRSALADLFLDTPLCNAHTTGTDVLWAGLPMVTLPLEKMATRVAGSLCLATGVGEEMIVNSMKEYEDKAVELAENRPKLQALKNKLKASRMTCPLFDTERWVRNLERAYFKMWNLYCSGGHPQPFKVTEMDSEFPYDR
ncbi:hypothetical protein ACLOJK_022758 [Asimina triloba]